MNFLQGMLSLKDMLREFSELTIDRLLLGLDIAGTFFHEECQMFDQFFFIRPACCFAWILPNVVRDDFLHPFNRSSLFPKIPYSPSSQILIGEQDFYGFLYISDLQEDVRNLCQPRDGGRDGAWRPGKVPLQ